MQQSSWYYENGISVRFSPSLRQQQRLWVRAVRDRGSSPLHSTNQNRYTMSGHLNFDRHAIFSMDDVKLVRQLIDKVMMNDDRDFFQNKLYGLFDGYLYGDLMQIAAFQLPTTDLMDLRKLVDKIKSDIAKTGHSYTPV